jgi:hypothetical protein
MVSNFFGRGRKVYDDAPPEYSSVQTDSLEDAEALKLIYRYVKMSRVIHTLGERDGMVYDDLEADLVGKTCGLVGDMIDPEWGSKFREILYRDGVVWYV